MSYTYNPSNYSVRGSESSKQNRSNINDILTNRVKDVLTTNVYNKGMTDTYTKKLGLVLSILK
jgi:hypothetical protein